MMHVTPGVVFSLSLDAHFVALCGLFVALVLLGAVLAGKLLYTLFKIPQVAGQIIGGIILGPTCINSADLQLFQQTVLVLDPVTAVEYGFSVSDLALFFVSVVTALLGVPYLLWLAGHETEVKNILRSGFTAVCAGILGALIPIGLIAVILQWYAWSWTQAVGMGMVFSATSVSISVAMLLAYRAMHTRAAQVTLGAAVVDDIFAVILLSLFVISVSGADSGQHHSVAHSLLSVGFVLAVMVGVGYVLVRPLVHLISEKKPLFLPTVATVVMLAYFAVAELVGHLAGITGAYFAGLFHRMGDHKHLAEKALAPFVQAILLPIFLGSIGFQVDMRLLGAHDWLLVFILLGASIVAKFAGCFIAMGISNLIAGFGSRSHWTLHEAYLFSAAMVARGEVGLVVATLLFGEHIFGHQQYVIAVVVIVLTTIATPLLLAPALRRLDVTSFV